MEGVLLDQEDRHLLLARDPADGLEDLPHNQRRQPKRGLVEQQQPRPAHQGAADRQHLLLAARQGAAALLAPLGQPGEHLEHPVEVFLEMHRIGDDGAHLQIFVDAHAREDTPAFRHLGHAPQHDLVGRQTGDVLAFQPDRAGPRARAAADRHQQGRLAGAVGADQGHDLAMGDIEVDPVQRLDGAIECRHRPDFKHGRFRHRDRPRRCRDRRE
jgi:hypothetical protein